MNETSEYLHEIFEAMGPIAVRRMFGGYGVFHSGLMFALFIAGRLYLKTDAQNIHHFKQFQCEPFRYEQKGRTIQMSYWSAPDLMMDERDQARLWGQIALDAAFRSKYPPLKSAS